MQLLWKIFMRPFICIYFSLIILLHLARPADAQSINRQVTSQDAAALQQDLRLWASNLLAPAVTPDAIPLEITAEGNRYRATLGLPMIPGVIISADNAATAFLAPIDGGRWDIHDIRVPSTARVTADMLGLPVRIRYRIAEQTARGEFDPAMKAPSFYRGTMRGITETVENADGPETVAMQEVIFENRFLPAQSNVLDATNRLTVNGYSADQKLKDGTTITYSADKIEMAAQAQGLNTLHLTTLLHDVAALGHQMATTNGGKEGPTSAQKQLFRHVLVQLGALFVAAEAKESISGVKFQVGPIAGTLQELAFFSSLQAPNGAAALRMGIGAAGFASDYVPADGLGQFIPKRIAIAPSISGTSKDALIQFLSEALDIADDDQALANGLLQFLAKNPVNVGIDELLIDLGTARLDGTGKVQIASPTDIDGTAELRMTGLEALMRRIGQSPETKGVLPALMMLKGIGQTDGNATVWRIAYSGNKLTVNGNDLSALIPD